MMTYDDLYDIFRSFMSRNKATEIIIKCRNLSWTPLCERCVRALQQANLTTSAAHSLKLSGGLWQVLWGVSKVDRADFGSTLVVKCCKLL